MKPNTPPIPQRLLEQLLAHLDREEAFFDSLCDVARATSRHPLHQTEAAWPGEFDRLSGEADDLAERRQRLQHLLKGHSPTGVVALSRVPVSDEARPLLDRRRREVRRAAARAAGMLRGLMISLAAWNEVTQSAIDALLGVSPQESTYSATGNRVARPRPVILETRS
jgi:hypothetical protein